MPSPVDTIIASASADIASIAQRFISGQLSAAQWAREMQITLARNWATSFRAGLGERPTPAQERWLRQEYNRHNTFVRNFQADLATGDLSEAQILNRANMYADRLRGLYEAGTAAAHDLVLPFTPGSCKTQCLTNCRCVLGYEQQDDRTVAVWHCRRDQESCPDCLALDGLPHTQWRAAIGR